jgi:hypothetical protein
MGGAERLLFFNGTRNYTKISQWTKIEKDMKERCDDRGKGAEREERGRKRKTLK